MSRGSLETQQDRVPPESGRGKSETHYTFADLIGAIREEHRAREDYGREAQALQNRQTAIVRRLTGCSKGAAPKMLKQVFDQFLSETQKSTVSASGNGQETFETHLEDAGILALCLPFRECQDLLKQRQKHHETNLRAMAKQLPVWAWVETVRGVGALSIAQIIGETGDLSGYANPAKTWKRMGLAVISYPCPKCHKEEFESFVEGQPTSESQIRYAKESHNSLETQSLHSDQTVIDTQASSVHVHPETQAPRDQQGGETQDSCVPDHGLSETQKSTVCKKCQGKGFIQEAQGKRVDKKLALLHGYNPSRRSVMWNIGECLIKQNDGKYRQMYDDQKSYQIQVNELTKGHAHNRAHRYMEKALLRDLWARWNEGLIV